MILGFIHAICMASVACLLALFLTPLVRGFMKRIGAVDLPDPRRVNRTPIPRGGGLAVVAAFFSALIVTYVVCPNLLAEDKVFVPILPTFCVATIILVTVGFVDDRFGLSPLFKLMIQLIVAGVMCWGGARLILPTSWGVFWASPWAYVPLTLVWYIAIINAFNLIDGLDGLSSGLAIIATIGMIGVGYFVNPTEIPLVALILIGALLGFLRYNYNPATVFLGDSGSLFIGLTLATFALTSRRGDAFLVSMGLPVLFLGVPIVDTFLAILRRTLRHVMLCTEDSEKKEGTGEAKMVMTADREHLHHRFLSLAKGNQRVAVWSLYCLGIGLVILGFITLAVKQSKASIFLIGFLGFVFVIVRMMTNVELWDAGHLLAKPGSRNGRKAIAIPTYILCDIVSMVVLFFFLILLLHPLLPALSGIQWSNVFLVYAVPVIVFMTFSKAYTRIWGRSMPRDRFSILIAIFLGSCISHIGISFVRPELSSALLRLHMLWAMLLPLPLICIRLARTAFLQYLSAFENRQLCRAALIDHSIERVLFYGAGLNLSAYLTIYNANVTCNHVALLGILDDDRGLRGRVFYGIPILGPLEVLEDHAYFQRIQPTKIILTTPTIPDSRLADIQAFCQNHKLSLTKCMLEESTVSLSSTL